MSETTIKLFEEESQSWTDDDIRKLYRELVTYDEEIKALQEAKRDHLKETLKAKGIPAKEFGQAVAIIKKELDTETLFEMTDVINEMRGSSD
tara:strand:+ start:1571 stop:1846 length:276 start_codon:yes stop_codon:yes gene_type:complete